MKLYKPNSTPLCACEHLANIHKVTSLLDRTSALEAENAALLSANSPKPSISPTPSAKARDKSRDSATPSNDPSIAQLRADLTESLRANGQLQARTKNAEAELSKLKVQSKNEGKQVEALTRERALLRQKVKDRDDELREKAKLLDVRPFGGRLNHVLFKEMLTEFPTECS